jgi:hypothetical protein
MSSVCDAPSRPALASIANARHCSAVGLIAVSPRYAAHSPKCSCKWPAWVERLFQVGALISGRPVGRPSAPEISTSSVPVPSPD